MTPTLKEAVNIEVFGEKSAHECMVCGLLTHIMGDLNNPNCIVYGETLCENCRVKLRELLGIIHTY